MDRARKLGRGSLVVLTLLSWLAGCAAPPKPRPKPPVAERAPAPPPAATPAPPPPPVETPSIGPRPEPPPPPPRAEPPPPPPPPTAPPVPPGQRGRFVVLNFDNADVETVIHAASEILGFNYVLAPDVRGKVTVQTSGRIAQEDVFGVLLAILEVHGFTAVKSGNLYKIMRIEGARERAVPTIVGLEVGPGRTADEIVTQIVAVRFSSVTDLSTLLRPLISTRGSLIAHRETNIIIITDAVANVRRLLDIIRLVDVAVTVDELQIIPIRFADAADLATILTQLFASGRVRRAAAAPVPGAPAPPPAPAPGAPPRPPTPLPATGEAVGTEHAPLIIAERRSNSLIVHARKPELETIRKLIGQLDINIYGGRRVFIYYAENGKAKDLAATLNAIYGAREAGLAPTTPAPPPAPGAPPRRPGEPPPSAPTPGALGGGVGEAGLIEGQVRFIPDDVTNSVIVTTFPRNWPEIEATIKQLDRQPRQVLIEVMVAEIQLTDDMRLGVDWAVRSGKVTVAQQSILATPSIPTIGNLPIGPGGLPALPFPGLTAFTFATNQFMLLLNTLASENKVNILSSPHVLTSENKKAVINVSRSVPIITGQQTSSVSTPGTTAGTTSTTITTGGVNQTVEYRDAGVILTVTPRIGERGTVALDVKQEVNEVGPRVEPTGSPSFNKREAETSVVLVNNQTLVLGGLIQEKVDTTDRGIPFLKDIPVLGYLFGAKVRNVTKTELLILITPRVIGTALDATRISDEKRRGSPEMEDAISRPPLPPMPVQPRPRTPPPPPPPSSP